MALSSMTGEVRGKNYSWTKLCMQLLCDMAMLGCIVMVS